jgi:hypothetical protein
MAERWRRWVLQRVTRKFQYRSATARKRLPLRQSKEPAPPMNPTGSVGDSAGMTIYSRSPISWTCSLHSVRGVPAETIHPPAAHYKPMDTQSRMQPGGAGCPSARRMCRLKLRGSKCRGACRSRIWTKNNGGGGGSRTPVRKALRHEAYMLSSIPFGSPATLRMSKKRSRLVRWFSPEPYGPKGSGQLTV